VNLLSEEEKPDAAEEDWTEEAEAEPVTSTPPAPPDKKRDVTILGVKTPREFLQEVDEAVELSKGKYENRSDLVRDVVGRYTRFIKEGGLDRLRQTEEEAWKEEKPTLARDKKYEASVKTALNLIEDLEDFSIPFLSDNFEDFIEEAKEKKLIGQTAVWSDSRIQKAMRDVFRDEVYSEESWDGKRKFRAAKAKEWRVALAKKIKIPEPVAKNLVEDPAFADLEPYEEWKD
jgi:Arc/MetJ-type ribon-helix-helix transcriptional regulator